MQFLYLDFTYLISEKLLKVPWATEKEVVGRQLDSTDIEDPTAKEDYLNILNKDNSDAETSNSFHFPLDQTLVINKDPGNSTDEISKFDNNNKNSNNSSIFISNCS